MAAFELVLPNLARLPQRGDLRARWALANELGLDVVELPADLVKNRREERITGIPIGGFLGPEAVDVLYSPGPPEARYVLHTDPGIPRRDGTMFIPELRWGEKGWTSGYADSLGLTARRLGPAPLMIEVHSGRHCDLEQVIEAAAGLAKAMRSRCGKEVMVGVENKVGQIMATGEDMARAGDLMDLSGEDALGIVLDVPNLWKSRGRRAPEDLDVVPIRRLLGVHVHDRHRPPDPGGQIDWEAVADLLERTDGALINPEVFHRRDLVATLEFIRERLLPGRLPSRKAWNGVGENPHKDGAV